MLNIIPQPLLGHKQISGRTMFMRPGIGTALRIEQALTTTCRRISAMEPGIVVVKRGRKLVRNAEIELVAEEGMAIVFPAGFEADIVNEVDTVGHYSAVSVVFSPAIINTQSSLLRPLAQISAMGEMPAPFVEAVDRAVEAICDPLLPDPVISHRVAELLLWLERQNVRLACPEQSDVVSKVKQLFGSAPEAAWPVKHVAARLGMSEATLRRRLARHGTSLSKLLLEVRMLTALTLLQAGDHSILQVSHAVGYDSPSHFAARFRQRFGFAPSDLR